MIAAVYARKSTDQSSIADEQKSVARQIEHARAFAASKGWTVDDAHVYVDDAYSGADFSRPGFLQLMNALKPRPLFQVLIMSEESRLGREAIETAYALKQIVQAGVRVWFYLEGRERTLDSPTDKIMLSLTAFADELEREKARQRTYDAMARKAKAGHVTGGRTFGYDNIEVLDAGGKRSHVERRINESEAAVIRRVFELSAAGHGVKAITKMLNADGLLSPRAQRGRSQSWAPSSVREVLRKDIYRGVVTWNRTRKRNRWGVDKQAARPSTEWLERRAAELQIVPGELWSAAHRRLEAVRAVYLKATNGRPFGRPALGDPSKYLLTSLASCGCCGSTLQVVSRSHGKSRKRLYGCSGYHERGICENGRDVPMADADDIVLEALLDDVIDRSIVSDSIDVAVALLREAEDAGRTAALDAEVGKLEDECRRLATAIATGGPLDGLLLALQAREQRRSGLRAERERLRTQKRLQASEIATVRNDLVTLSNEWRRVLADDPANARPIISSLLKGRVTFTPLSKPGWWQLRGDGHLSGLFSNEWTGRVRVPNGIRTRVLALKGPRPRPLDDGDPRRELQSLARGRKATAPGRQSLTRCREPRDCRSSW
jgi:site-specific DNA recombinase